MHTGLACQRVLCLRPKVRGGRALGAQPPLVCRITVLTSTMRGGRIHQSPEWPAVYAHPALSQGGFWRIFKLSGRFFGLADA
jgi:hypothetical protein